MHIYITALIFLLKIKKTLITKGFKLNIFLDKKKEVKENGDEKYDLSDVLPPAIKVGKLTTESYCTAIMLSRGSGCEVRHSDLIKKMHKSLLELDEISRQPDFENNSVFTDICYNRILNSIELLLEDFHNGNRKIDVIPNKKTKGKNEDRRFH